MDILYGGENLTTNKGKTMGKQREQLMINYDKINAVQNGDLPTTTKVGRCVLDGAWRAVFLQTDKEGNFIVNKDGEVQFNIV